MHWNYRIVRHKSGDEEYYLIHETFYGEDGKPDVIDMGAQAYGDTPDELIAVIEMMLADLKRSRDDILNADDFYNPDLSELLDAEQPDIYGLMEEE